MRVAYWLKGYWLLEQENFTDAIEPLQVAIQMAHQIKLPDFSSETLMAIAQFHTGRLENPEETAERLTHVSNPSYLHLAELWWLLKNIKKAKDFALKAYEWAWADGEPYVHRFGLNKSVALLEKLNISIPQLPAFNASRYVKEDWEIQLDAYIEKRQQEAEAKKTKEDTE